MALIQRPPNKNWPRLFTTWQEDDDPRDGGVTLTSASKRAWKKVVQAAWGIDMISPRQKERFLRFLEKGYPYDNDIRIDILGAIIENIQRDPNGDIKEDSMAAAETILPYIPTPMLRWLTRTSRLLTVQERKKLEQDLIKGVRCHTAPNVTCIRLFDTWPYDEDPAESGATFSKQDESDWALLEKTAIAMGALFPESESKGGYDSSSRIGILDEIRMRLKGWQFEKKVARRIMPYMSDEFLIWIDNAYWIVPEERAKLMVFLSSRGATGAVPLFTNLPEVVPDPRKSGLKLTPKVRRNWKMIVHNLYNKEAHFYEIPHKSATLGHPEEYFLKLFSETKLSEDPRMTLLYTIRNTIYRTSSRDTWVAEGMMPFISTPFLQWVYDFRPKGQEYLEAFYGAEDEDEDIDFAAIQQRMQNMPRSPKEAKEIEHRLKVLQKLSASTTTTPKPQRQRNLYRDLTQIEAYERQVGLGSEDEAMGSELSEDEDIPHERRVSNLLIRPPSSE